MATYNVQFYAESAEGVVEVQGSADVQVLASEIETFAGYIPDLNVAEVSQAIVRSKLDVLFVGYDVRIFWDTLTLL